MTTPQPQPTQPTLFEQRLDTEVRMVKLSHIKPPDARKLNASVGKIGVIQPVLLRPCASGDYRFEVVDGNRRTYSALHYELQEIPAIITDGSAPQIAAARLSANVARSPNPLQEARALQQILHSGTYADVGSMARDLELPLNTIKSLLKLAQLPEVVLRAVEDRKIPVGTAQQMAKLAPSYQKAAVEKLEEAIRTGEEFTAADVKDVKVKRTTDLANTLSSALGQLPALTPLLEISPVQRLAEEVPQMGHHRQVDLNHLIAELKKLSANAVFDNPVTIKPDVPLKKKAGGIDAPVQSKVQTELPDVFALGDTAPAALPAAFKGNAKEEQNTPRPIVEESLPAAFLSPKPQASTPEQTAVEMNNDPFGDIPGYTAATTPVEANGQEEALPAAFLSKEEPEPKAQPTIPTTPTRGRLRTIVPRG